MQYFRIVHVHNGPAEVLQFQLISDDATNTKTLNGGGF